MRCIKHFNRCLKQEHFSLPRQTVCLFFAAILYPFAIWLVGLETATFCILCLLLFINGIRNIFLLLGIPAIITILFWIVFRCLLDIFFPEPLIFHMLS